MEFLVDVCRLCSDVEVTGEFLWEFFTHIYDGFLRAEKKSRDKEEQLLVSFPHTNPDIIQLDIYKH